MTERFALILMAGTVPLFFAASYPAAFAFMAVYNASAVALWAWDRSQIPTGLLTADRECSPTWRLGQPQKVVLKLTSASGRDAVFDVREDLPRSVDAEVQDASQVPVTELALGTAEDVALLALGVGLPGGADEVAHPRLRLPGSSGDPESPDWAQGELPASESEGSGPRAETLPLPLGIVPQRLTLAPHHQKCLEYTLTPRQRGALNLGAVHVRRFGPLGLAYRQDVIHDTTQVQVIADLPHAGKLGALQDRPDSMDVGALPSRRKGSGLELESLRGYVAGDEVRKISWKATARRGRTVVKETVEETGQQVVILLDTGRAMGGRIGVQGEPDAATSGDPVRTRLDLAVETATVLVKAAMEQHDRIGAWTFAGEVVDHAKPSRGQKPAMRVNSILRDARAVASPSDPRVAAVHLLGLVRRRSLVVMLTELPSYPDRGALEEAVRLLGLRHSVVVLTHRDPVLDEQVAAPAPHAQDAFRRSAAAHMLSERNAVVGSLRQAGHTIVDLRPGEVSPSMLGRILRTGRQRRS